MKKTWFVPLVAAVVVLVFGACAATGVKDPSTIEERITTSDTSALIEGVKDGSNIPSSMHFFAAEFANRTFDDPELIREVFTTLMKQEVLADPADVDILDGTMIFDFSWEDGQVLSVSFETSEYFCQNGKLYPLTDNSELSALMQQLDRHE